jgi:hypothetical protein
MNAPNAKNNGRSVVHHLMRLPWNFALDCLLAKAHRLQSVHNPSSLMEF